MKFLELAIKGLYQIELTPHEDERGFFARSWCALEFEKAGLSNSLLQCNISFNIKKGTLRGLHFQTAPHEEDKLVRCTKGKIFDVAVDLRPTSSSFGKWYGTELSADNHLALYIPKGFAHGFQTLEENSEVFYQMGEVYHPESQAGLHWQDGDINIQWPIAEPFVSSKDQSHPRLKQLELNKR
ncbi:MAG: dTDP-4-dehydrorhamnose 3,5-epimerase [Oligoflexales bacterium]|nr:dTDP-4-dehydrorhamnose 3,5-epimerase [Oligoflexales bacterium]